MKITPHPIFTAPTDREIAALKQKHGIEYVREFLINREKLIEQSKENPLEYGYEQECWAWADQSLDQNLRTLIMGGNRSGKTRYGGRTVVKAAKLNPESKIMCFAQDEASSVKIQQAYVWQYLTPEDKAIGKTSSAYINYKEKNGFSGEPASFILENGSEVIFVTYSQYIANRNKFEGYELGSYNPTWHNVGIWFDEYLGDASLVDTMRFRLIDRDARMFLTFTPKDFKTPFVSTFVDKAETIREAEIDGRFNVKKKKVPIIQRNENYDAGIVYFHSKFNKFLNYDRLVRELKSDSEDVILMRAYGYPTESMKSMFPLFNEKVHVFDKIPPISSKTHTLYQVDDPADRRSHACIWATVDGRGNIDVLREWPDRGHYGEWAIAKDQNKDGQTIWKEGIAQGKTIYSIKGYADLFRTIERELGIKPFERIGDSRFFAKKELDGSDLFDDFYNEEGMIFVPSSGVDITSGISRIEHFLEYNPNYPISSVNKPKLRIHKSCGNLIHCLQNWSNLGKVDEPLKDFVDLLRYLCTHNNGAGPLFIDEKLFKVKVNKKGGY